jgi:elongation factor P
MGTSNQLTPGMTISLDGGLYRVESCVKVSVARGQPFLKASLKDLRTDELIERNFKPNQAVEEVTVSERRLEFLYLEGSDFLFLDLDNLDQVLVPADVVGDKARFLKEGVEVKAICYGDTIFSIDLPQFLELMVVKVENPDRAAGVAATTKWASLETGARLEVPLFIEAGDIVKVDTAQNEYIQRV